jgi:chromosome partitioning protein
MLVIALLQLKGGSGRTTLSTNLAAAAHLANLRTLIVDLDKQGSALDWAAARVDGSKLNGLAVVKADRALSLPRFKEIARGYDVVILDGPPRLGDVTQAAAVCADVVLTPVRPGAFDFWAVGETAEFLEQADAVRDQLGRKPVRRVLVVNMAIVGSRLAEEAPTALKEVGQVVGVIHNRIAFADAAARGESVLTTAPSSQAADEITALWRALKKGGN